MATRNNEEEDRLSKLPDDILVKILSRLPTLDSVRTCVLSKRWVHLWTHITSLYFDIDDYELRLISAHQFHFNVEYSFQRFVSMVFSRLSSPTLESFSLSSNGLAYFEQIFEQCCPHLVNKRLRDLYLSCQSSFGGSILSCQTLEYLGLQLFSSSLVFPNFVHLPNLQTLELYCCGFVSERNYFEGFVSERNYFEEISQNNIILSFPVLKKLKSIDVCWYRFQSVSFEVPLLQRLEIEHDIVYADDVKFLVNYNFSTNPYVRIDSHELLGIIPSDSEQERMDRGLRACIFLQKYLHINKVKHLELSSTEAFLFAKESFVDFPSFNILRHLKLRKVCGEMLVVFLVKSPHLTSLTIQMEKVPSPLLRSNEVVSLQDHAEKLLDYGIVPDCISYALKKFKIENFYGDEEQLRLVKYIMENAQNLEFLSVSPSELFQRSSDSNNENIKETLLLYKRSLNLTVTIDFSGLF